MVTFILDLVRNHRFMSKSNKETFLFGCASSFIACFAFQPLDILKTQIQENLHFTCESDIKYKKQKNYLNIIKNIYFKNGMVGFWKGLSK